MAEVIAVDMRGNDRSLLIRNIAGWAVVFGIAILALATSAGATMRAFQFLRRRGTHTGVAGVVTVGVALVTFSGLWLVIDAYWVVRWIIVVPSRLCRVRLEDGP